MTRRRKYPVTADESLHPVLQHQLAMLRGGMLGAAEKSPLPARFTTRPDADRPAIFITDTRSGRSTLVGLCDYHGARQALHDLFAEDEANR
jgi:hypothetical protein